jgi:hypothetical protein
MKHPQNILIARAEKKKLRQVNKAAVAANRRLIQQYLQQKEARREVPRIERTPYEATFIQDSSAPQPVPS